MDLSRAELVERAMRQVADGRLGEAQQTLRTLVSLAPDLGAARAELGRVLAMAGDLEAARVELTASAPAAGPAAWVDLGAVLGRLGRLDEEKKAYGQVGAAGESWELAFNRGLAAAEAGEAGGVAEAARALVGRWPERAEGPYLEGLAAELRGDPERAVEAYGAAHRARPGLWQAGYALGRLLTEAGRGGEAVPVLEAVRAEAGARWEVALALGNALAGTGQREPAKAALAEAARLAPPGEGAPLVNLAELLAEAGAAEEACVLLRAALQKAPGSTELRLELAKTCFAAGKAAEAVDLYRQVVEAEPQHFRARYNLAFALERAGRDAEALEAYQRALAQSPGHYKTLNRIAGLHQKKGDFAAALAAADASLGHEQKANGEGWLARGLALKGLGRGAESLVALEEASRRDPEGPAVWRELAYAERRRGELERAKDAAKRALALAPDDPQALMELGLCYLEGPGGDEALAKARTAFKRILEKTPASAKALACLAQVSALADEPAKAYERAKAAVEAHGGYRAYMAMGDSLRRLGRPEKAIEAYKQCLTRNKGYAPGYQGIAQAYEALGQADKAGKYKALYESHRAAGGSVGDTTELGGGEE